VAASCADQAVQLAAALVRAAAVAGGARVNWPDERPKLDHAAAAADHVLALIVAADPTFRATPKRHDAMVALVQAVARAVAAGGAR
jgi:hypothetical protein